MKPALLEFPREAEWIELQKASPFVELLETLERFPRPITGSDADAFAKSIELGSLATEVHQRLGGASRSHSLMLFYYKQGIPDKRWHISPGSSGSSVEYFPDFEDHHFALKGWFDFYSDTLYHKIFSAWDLVGHILNVKHDLKISMVDFGKAVAAGIKSDPVFQDTWKPIVDSPEYNKAKGIRNNITHNYLPGSVGIAVTRGKNSLGFGLKEYIPSEEIVSTAAQAIDLLKLTLLKITA